MTIKQWGFVFSFFFVVWNSFGQGVYVAPDAFFKLGPVAMGRAGSVVASDVKFDSFVLNPSAPAFKKSYHLTGTYLNHGAAWALSITDSKSSKIGATAHYSQYSLKKLFDDLSYGNFKRKEKLMGLSLFGKIHKKVSLGLTGKYKNRKSFEASLEDQKAFNGDIGVTVLLDPQFRLGASASNLLKDEEGFFLKNYRLGMEYIWRRSLFVSGQMTFHEETDDDSDYFIPESKSKSISLGIEYSYQNKYSVRAGYRDNGAWKNTYYTLGLGLIDKGARFDYAFVYLNTTPENDAKKALYHSFALSTSF